jgi:hypothetical protein
MVSSFCKDHHFGREVDSQKSLRALKLEVVRLSEGIYHGDGLYPTTLVTPPPPKFVLRLRNASSRWCKRRMNQGEVLSMMDVSDNICVAMPEELWAVLLRGPKLAPVKVMVTTALAVIRECRGGGRFRSGGSLSVRERFPSFSCLEFSPLKV